MDLKGSHEFSAPRAVVWEALTDPEVLAKATPGCQSLREVEPDTYEVEMKLGIAAVKGNYKGKVSIREKNEPESFRLDISGEGGPGFVNTFMNIQLEDKGERTRLDYQGEAQVGGMIAGVGQRMLGGVAKMILGQFFKALEKEVELRNAN